MAAQNCPKRPHFLQQAMRRLGQVSTRVPVEEPSTASQADVAPAILALVRPAGVLAQEHQEMPLIGFLQLPIRAQLVHDGWKMLCKSPKYLVDWQTE
jgi:hypothetical protein